MVSDLEHEALPLKPQRAEEHAPFRRGCAAAGKRHAIRNGDLELLSTRAMVADRAEIDLNSVFYPNYLLPRLQCCQQLVARGNPRIGIASLDWRLNILLGN